MLWVQHLHIYININNEKKQNLANIFILKPSMHDFTKMEYMILPLLNITCRGETFEPEAFAKP